ncbi:MAG TPA: sulfatase [Vicinamibacteria bacterium]|nr:sulfatase [Vicinamibacteria bacterium]
MTPAGSRLASTLRAFGAGALFGAALSVAEVFTGTLSGGRLPFAWWAFLMAYYVPLLAALGALLLARPFSGGGSSTGGLDLRSLAVVVQASYTIVVANHEYLRQQPFASPERLATVILAGTLGLLEARRPGLPSGLGLLLVRPFLFTAAAWLATSAVRTGVPIADALSFVLLAHLVTAAGFGLWWRALGPEGWRGWVRRGLAATAAGVCAWGMLAPGRGLSPGRPRTGAAPAGLGGRAERPNIVLIVLDTVGASRLSGYGYPRPTSPNLDAFARRSVLYINCLAPAGWTIPSHASLFTGLYPFQHGCDFAATDSGCRLMALDQGHRTLAEVLATMGYASAAIAGNGPAFTARVGLERGFDHVDARPARTGDLAFLPLLRRLEGRLPPWILREWRERWLPQGWRSAEEIGREALRWLERRRPQDRPYFLFLNFMDTHVPFRWHEGFSDRWAGRAESLPLAGLPSSRQGKPLTREEYEHVRALYDASLAYLDHHVGRLLEALARRPDWDRTWVFVTGDHGDSLAEGRVFAHGCSELTQQVLHVPLIVRYPAGAGSEPGTRDESPVQLVDIVPTLYAALGLPAPPGSARLGQRRTAMMAGGTCLPRRPGAPCPAYEVLVEGGWKYVRPPEGPPQLFDLKADREETRDLALERPLERQAAEESLARFKAALGGARARSPREAGPETLEGLEALGYIQ